MSACPSSLCGTHVRCNIVLGHTGCECCDGDLQHIPNNALRHQSAHNIHGAVTDVSFNRFLIDEHLRGPVFIISKAALTWLGTQSPTSSHATYSVIHTNRMQVDLQSAAGHTGFDDADLEVALRMTTSESKCQASHNATAHKLMPMSNAQQQTCTEQHPTHIAIAYKDTNITRKCNNIH